MYPKPPPRTTRQLTLAPNRASTASLPRVNRGPHALTLTPHTGSDQTGVITTFAGGNGQGFSGSGGPATSAKLDTPSRISLLGTSLYVCEWGAGAIRRIDAAGIIHNVTGTGTWAWVDGPVASAQFFGITDFAFTPNGATIWIADDYPWHMIRKLDVATGIVSTVAGCANGWPCGWNQPFVSINAMVYRPNDGLLFADNDAIRHMNDSGYYSYWHSNLQHGMITFNQGYAGDGLPFSGSTVMNDVRGLAVDASGNVFVAAQANSVIRKVTAPLDIITTVLGDPTPGMPTVASSAAPQAFMANQHQLSLPWGHMANGYNDSIIICNAGANNIILVSKFGVARIIAGIGIQGYSGDGGPALQASFYSPSSASLDFARGIYYVCDLQNNVLRAFTDGGVINTVAGGGSVNGEHVPGLALFLDNPQAVVVDRVGNAIITNFKGQVVQKLWIGANNVFVNSTILCGILNTGTSPVPYSGPMLGSQIALSNPGDISINPVTGDLAFIDQFGYRVFLINATTGRVSRLFGNGIRTSVDGHTTNASIEWANSMVYSSDGTKLYVADTYAFTVREFNFATGMLTTIAGSGENLSAGDGPGSPLNISFHFDFGIGVSSDGSLFVADYYANTIRQIILRPTPILCAAGYFCSCGRNPLPCTNISQACPANSIAPQTIAPGFVAVIGPGLVPGSASVNVNQEHCPMGSFCSGGVRTLCPGGTFSPSTYQVSLQDCFPCTGNTYSVVDGASAVSACMPCPNGTRATLPGSPFCRMCPQGQVWMANGQCQACPSGTTALSGSPGCVPLAATDSVNIVGASNSFFQRDQAPNTGNADPASSASVTAGAIAVIMIIFAIPTFLLYLGNLYHGRHETLRKSLMSLDSLSLEHETEAFEAKVDKPTPIGGALTVMGWGAFVCAAIALLVQYAQQNTLMQRSLLPLDYASTNGIGASLNNYVVPTGTSATPSLLPIVSGFSISISTMGLRCAQPSFDLSPLVSGAFATRTTSDPVTGSVLHVITCANCMPDPASILTVTLDGSCRTFVVNVAGLGAFGSYSLASFAAENVSAITATVPLAVQIVQDAVASANVDKNNLMTKGHSARGISVFPVSNVITSAAGAWAASQTMLRVNMPLQPTYTIVVLQPILTAINLISGVLGLTSMTGIALILFKLHNKLPRKLQVVGWAREIQHKHAPSGSGSGTSGNIIAADDFAVQNPMVANKIAPAAIGADSATVSAAAAPAPLAAAHGTSSLTLNVGGGVHE